MRISIIGLSGSGKTTLAKVISEKLSIPHIHLDRFWFEAGGLEADKNGSAEESERVRLHMSEKVLAELSADSWVSDGNYSRLQPEISSRADAIIFLDIPLWRRLLNHAKRMLKPSSRHKEVNIWDDLIFFPEIIRRTFLKGPKLRKFVDEYRDKVIILKSRNDIDRYLRTID